MREPCNNEDMQYVPRFSCAKFFVLVTGFLFLIPHTTFAAQSTITIGDNSFTPKNLSINPGDTVRWVNNGSSSHTVTADDRSFDSVTIAPGQSFVAIFNLAGNYPYHCKFHGGSGGVGQAGVVTVVTPAPAVAASTNTVSQLQAQIQALMNQVNALKGQTTTGSASGGGIGSNSSACPLVGRSLKKGISGDDVARLQQFLARDRTVYPEATVSGYYGALTEAAVQRWQVKYNIVSSGTPATTGYGVVGPRTASAIALLCTTGSYGGVSAQNVDTSTVPKVGGFITVSPISGNAPLTVKIAATVNTTDSCQAATYTLDFGDGSLPVQIPVIAGSCKQFSQLHPHTYKYGGVYTVKLSAGGHQTSATVTVVGPPPPVFTQGLPRETFNVTPLSGGAPLTVTFSGVVNSNNAGFCEDGCASVLDFGDGSQETVDLPGSVGGWLNYSVTHTYTQSGGFRATLYQGGAGASQPIVGSATIIVGFGSPAAPTITPAVIPATTTVTGTASSYQYNRPAVTPTGNDPLKFAITFDLPSICTAFNLTWGEESFVSIWQNDGGASCAQTPAQKSFSHQYSGGGTYNIILKRGSTLSRIDQSTLTIGN